jgi:malonyl-CoA/methylmalonyl-CoA synthetase
MSELLERFSRRSDCANRADADRTALVDRGGAYSYGSVARAARDVRNFLLDGGSSERWRERGLQGERVAVLASPSAAFVATLLGVWLAGGCVVVLSPLHPAPELRYFCTDAGVRTVLLTSGEETSAVPSDDAWIVRHVRPFDAHGPHSPDVAAGSLPVPTLPSGEMPALQLYTSGTTGKPKGAVLLHRNLAVQQALVGAAWAFSGGDVLLHALPLHHMHGLAIALLTALGAGATTHLTTFDVRRIWEQMSDVTVFMGVPSVI